MDHFFQIERLIEQVMRIADSTDAMAIRQDRIADATERMANAAEEANRLMARVAGETEPPRPARKNPFVGYDE